MKCALLFRDKCVEKRKTSHTWSTIFNLNRSLDRNSADCYREDNFLSSFIFLWASCFFNPIGAALISKDTALSIRPYKYRVRNSPKA